jgi:uncharacterized protein YdaT
MLTALEGASVESLRDARVHFKDRALHAGAVQKTLEEAEKAFKCEKQAAAAKASLDARQRGAENAALAQAKRMRTARRSR